MPRDGRFIEKLGTYDPLLPKDDAERVMLDMEKAKAWIAKGAQPTDRVLRFLDAAGVLKREARNNPEKAQPKKKAQERAAEQAKAASRRRVKAPPRSEIIRRGSGETAAAGPCRDERACGIALPMQAALLLRRQLPRMRDRSARPPSRRSHAQRPASSSASSARRMACGARCG